MEQIQQTGAFGIFRFSAEEQEALEIMRGVFDKIRSRTAHSYVWFQDIADSKDQDRVEIAAKTLFPAKNSTIGSSERYLRIRDCKVNSGKGYLGIGEGPETMFEATIELGSRGHSGRIELITLTGEREHGLSFIFENSDRSLESDLVNIMGKGQDPVLYGPQRSAYLNDRSGRGVIGLPQINRLEQVSVLYSRAQNLLVMDKVKGPIGKLIALEKAMGSDPNPAVKEMSRRMYYEELAKLLIRGPR